MVLVKTNLPILTTSNVPILPTTNLNYFNHLQCWGVWIAEWYHTWLWSLVHCAMHWAVSLSLSDNKLFFGPKHNIYALFMILFGLFDLILLFVCLICHVNCETENWK